MFISISITFITKGWKEKQTSKKKIKTKETFQFFWGASLKKNKTQSKTENTHLRIVQKLSLSYQSRHVSHMLIAVNNIRRPCAHSWQLGPRSRMAPEIIQEESRDPDQPPWFFSYVQILKSSNNNSWLCFSSHAPALSLQWKENQEQGGKTHTLGSQSCTG